MTIAQINNRKVWMATEHYMDETPVGPEFFFFLISQSAPAPPPPPQKKKITLKRVKITDGF
jgi:hypothetical protein